jgi:hypothetical protein
MPRIECQGRSLADLKPNASSSPLGDECGRTAPATNYSAGLQPLLAAPKFSRQFRPLAWMRQAIWLSESQTSRATARSRRLFSGPIPKVCTSRRSAAEGRAHRVAPIAPSRFPAIRELNFPEPNCSGPRERQAPSMAALNPGNARCAEGFGQCGLKVDGLPPPHWIEVLDDLGQQPHAEPTDRRARLVA